MQEQDLPVGPHREDDPNDDTVLFPQLVEIPVLLNGKVLVMGFLQPRGRRMGQAENLPDQLVPQLRFQPLNEGFHLADAAGGLVYFDVVYDSHSLLILIELLQMGNKALREQLRRNRIAADPPDRVRQTAVDGIVLQTYQ